MKSGLKSLRPSTHAHLMKIANPLPTPRPGERPGAASGAGVHVSRTGWRVVACWRVRLGDQATESRTPLFDSR